MNLTLKKSLLPLIFSCLFLSARAQKTARQSFDQAPPPVLEALGRADSCQDSGSDQCGAWYRKAISYAAKSAPEYESGLYCKLGYYFYTSGMPDSILTCVWKGFPGAQRREEYFNAGTLLNLAGTAYAATGEQPDSALHYFLEAGKYFNRIKDTIQIAQNLSNIGGIYVDINDNETALRYYLKAYEILKPVKDVKMKPVVAYNIGEHYFRKRNWALAEQWAQYAFNIVAPTDQEMTKCAVNMLLSSVLVEQGKYDSAQAYIQASLHYGRELGDDMLLGDALVNYARLLMHGKQFRQALDTAKEGIRLQESVQNLNGLSRAYFVAAEAAYGLGDYRYAADYYRQQSELVDTMLSEKNITAVKEVNARYEAEKKERLIAEQQLLLQRKAAQTRLWLTAGGLLIAGLLLFLLQYRRIQKARLARSEQEKENAVLKAWMNGEERERNRISRDLHDGVAAMLGAARMNLDAIPYLDSSRQKEQLDKVAGILESTHTDVRRIAHNLLPVTLQQEGLVAAVRHFAAGVNQTGILTLEITDRLPEKAMAGKQTELMLFRIVQELINNIIKHSRATEASVLFQWKEPWLEIEVKDNGQGFVESRTGDRQGLYSIRERLNALGGELDLDSRSGQGTRVLLRISLEKTGA